MTSHHFHITIFTELKLALQIPPWLCQHFFLWSIITTTMLHIFLLGVTLVCESNEWGMRMNGTYIGLRHTNTWGSVIWGKWRAVPRGSKWCFFVRCCEVRWKVLFFWAGAGAVRSKFPLYYTCELSVVFAGLWDFLQNAKETWMGEGPREDGEIGR